MFVRKSIGVILCRMNKNVPEVLLIKKRCSYAFCEFVQGKLFTSTNQFDKMTRDEMCDILTLDFDIIWNRYSPNNSKYINIKRELFKKYLKDNGKKITNLIISTQKKVDLMWECPKGSQHKLEDEITCAIRELKEETGIDKKDYTIVGNLNKYTSHVSNKTLYKVKYYVAYTDKKLNLYCKLEDYIKTNEIIDMKWFNILQLIQMDLIKLTFNIAPMVRPIFNIIRKEYKKARKNIIKEIIEMHDKPKT